MKIYEFDNYDELEACKPGSVPEEVILIVNRGDYATADLLTKCKKPITAVNRFFKALKEYKYFMDWEETIVESIHNGFYTDKEMYNGRYTGGYFWGVEDYDGYYYVFIHVKK